MKFIWILTIDYNLQCLVLTTTYFLNVQQGINMMMPTVIIGALNTNNTDDDSFIKVTDEESSWIGECYYVTIKV